MTAPESPVLRGEQVGDVLVDFGQIGICGRDSVEAAFEMLGDAGMPRYYNQLNTDALVAWVELPNATKILTVRPGLGDGTFPFTGYWDQTTFDVESRSIVCQRRSRNPYA